MIASACSIFRPLRSASSMPTCRHENADTVAQKARCVGTLNNPFTQNSVAEISQVVDNVILFGAAHQFQQSHLAHGIKEMCDGKARLEGGVHFFNQQFDRNGRCI